MMGSVLLLLLKAPINSTKNGAFRLLQGVKNNITSELRKLGYGWVDWTAMNGDGRYVANTSVAMKNLKNTINDDIEVILFHDYSYVTLAMLPEVIEYLQSKNYVLLPLFYESKIVNK